MTRHARTLLVASLTVGLAVPAAASATPTLRIEGADRTLLPETSIAPPQSPVTISDPGGAGQVTVPATSATAQLAAGARIAGLPIGFQVFDLGSGPSSFITRIGTDVMPPAFSPSWRLTVNHRAAATGSDATTVGGDDRVVWAFVPDFEVRELDIAVTGDLFRRGDPIDVRVTSHATDGTSAPASGATVSFGGETATADADGSVHLTADGEGPRAIAATRAGEVRSPAHVVCTIDDDPGACGLFARMTPGGTAGVATASADTIAPGSRIRFPRIGRGNRGVRGVAGTAGPDRSDISRVDVAVARRVGTQCRFLRRNGRYTHLRPCRSPLMVPARRAGSRWLRPLGRTLEPGLYRIWSRATDGAGNTQTRGVPRVNAGQFRVIR